MLTIAKNKTELNRIVKDIQVVFPEMIVSSGAIVTKGTFEGIEVFSALKCRGGYSLLLNDMFFDSRPIEDKRQSLEKMLDK